MKGIFIRPLLPYLVFVLLSMIGAGFALGQVTDNLPVLIAVLAILFFIFAIILSILANNFIRPLGKATEAIEKITEGNYNVRFHITSSKEIVELGHRINSLARSMSEITIQEEMQSEQLSTIIDNMQSGLVLIDEKGYIHLVNKKFVSMFGKTEKDYKGYLYYDVLEDEQFHETVQRTFLYEKNMKETVKHQMGLNKKYLEVVGAPIINERNILKGAVLVVYDITELKKLEKTRKDFVANVSHELRTPITSIKGFAETMLDNGMVDEDKRREFLEIIYKESHRLQLLVEDLLALSTLEKEDFRLVNEKVRAGELIDEVLPSLVHKAEDKGLSFSMDVDRELELYVDKERIKQVIINLIDNAIHYTPETGSVSLSLGSTDEHVRIKVTDTGIGIEEKAIPRVFERFYRVDKARSRNTGGTGLGLAIVKHIVEVHNGKIEVDSTVNEGTGISIYLPK